jgi:lipopolysaccharide/colanic/teichoic acid biosynthesis glycosyltransferase
VSQCAAIRGQGDEAVSKRVFDFVLALLGLILSSPVLAVISAWIKMDSKGPVFYRGVRVGRHGEPFRMFKFRTMIVDADKVGGSSSPDDDPRITCVGRILRRYKLDELPQLFNVLTGDMSLVGPRPQVKWAVNLYTPAERQVLSVRPGMTDYASVRFPNEGEILKGSKDPDKDYMELIHPEKMRLSLEYVRDQSFLVDLKVLLQTVMAIVRK